MMPQSSPGSPNPFAVTPQPGPRAGERAPELDRLKRAYADALALIEPKP